MLTGRKSPGMETSTLHLHDRQLPAKAQLQGRSPERGGVQIWAESREVEHTQGRSPEMGGVHTPVPNLDVSKGGLLVAGFLFAVKLSWVCFASFGGSAGSNSRCIAGPGWFSFFHLLP